MSKCKVIAVVLLSYLIQCIPAHAQKASDVEFTPMQDVFLYGEDVSLKFVFTNPTNDTSYVWGVSGINPVHIFRSNEFERPDGYVGRPPKDGYRALMPRETLVIEKSINGFRPYEQGGITAIRKDSLYNVFFPLGSFIVYASYKIGDGPDDDWNSYISCRFDVQMPTGAEKVVFDSLLMASLLEKRLTGETEKYRAEARNIKRTLLKNNPQSRYRHALFVYVIKGYYVEYGSSGAARKCFELSNWYLENSGEYYPEALKVSIGEIARYYETNGDVVGLENRLNEVLGMTDDPYCQQYISNQINVHCKTIPSSLGK